MTETRRKPRWWLRILITLVVIGALAGAAELALRAILPAPVANVMRDMFGLSPDHPVDVQLGGSTLLNAVTGRIGDVTVEIDDAAIVEGLRGDLRMHADSLPFDAASGAIEGATAQFTVDREDLPAAVAMLTGGIADSGEVREGVLTVGKKLEIFGVGMQVSVSIGLDVVDGEVLVNPVALRAAGFDLSTEQLTSMLGLSEQTVCVAGYIPAGITLTGIDLSSTGSVSLRADVAPDIAANPAQQQPGTCAG